MLESPRSTARGPRVPPVVAPLEGSFRRLVSETVLYQRRLAREKGLTVPQLICLRTLELDGPLQPSLLAERFGVSRPAVSSDLANLARTGWVRLDHPQGDRRSIVATLTPRALRVLREMREEGHTLFEEATRGVPAHEREVLSRWMETMVRALQAHRGAEEEAGCP